MERSASHSAAERERSVLICLHAFECSYAILRCVLTAMIAASRHHIDVPASRYDDRGRYRGTDPDPFIRSQLERCREC